jgi:uncharacterized protein YaiI (UPF0178 family)
VTERQILVDADACPVKEEIYKVALRHGIAVTIVSNQRLRVPEHPLIRREVVSDGFDAADDWIAQASSAGCVVITADILLADRCLKAGASVLAPNGKAFTESSIGAAIATRAIMADLRAGAVGDPIGGPAPFSKADRSRFLSALDEVLVRLGRAIPAADPCGAGPSNHQRRFPGQPKVKKMSGHVLVDRARVPDGVELQLLRSGGDFIIAIGDNELMSTDIYASEQSLANLTCQRLGALAARNS